MSEIEQMYENAGVELIEGLEWVCQNPDHCVYQNLSVVPENCIGCEHFKKEMRYPPFTPEKQIELIKLLAEKDNIYIIYYPSDNAYNIRYCVSGFYDGSVTGDKEVTNADFKEALAEIINSLWQDLTPEEKQQVKGILE